MNDLIYFETFTEGWRYAQMSNPYYSFGAPSHLVGPESHAAAAIMDYVRERQSTAGWLWDTGDFVYGLS